MTKTHTNSKKNLAVWEYPSVINKFSQDPITYARMVELSNVLVKKDDFKTFTKECIQYIYTEMFGIELAKSELKRYIIQVGIDNTSCRGGYHKYRPFVKMTSHNNTKELGRCQSVDVFIHEIAHALQYTLIFSGTDKEIWTKTLLAIEKYTGKTYKAEDIRMYAKGHSKLWQELYRTMLAIYTKDTKISKEAMKSAPSKCKKISNPLIAEYKRNNKPHAWIMDNHLLWFDINYAKFVATPIIEDLETTIHACKMRWCGNPDMQSRSLAGLKQLIHLNK